MKRPGVSGLELNRNYRLVVYPDNSVSSACLNAREFLMIIEEVLKNCAKFLPEAFEKSGHFNDAKTLDERILNSHQFGNKQATKRYTCPKFEAEFDPWPVSPATPCIYGCLVSSIKMAEHDHETWLLVTLEGNLLLAELDVCKLTPKSDSYGNVDCDEIVYFARFMLDRGSSKSNLDGEYIDQKIMPYMDSQVARGILYGALDVLSFEKLRRERENREFLAACDFWEMVSRRLHFAE